MAGPNPKTLRLQAQLRRIAEELGQSIARHRDAKWHGNEVDDKLDAELYEALVWAEEYDFAFQPPLDLEP